MAEWGVDVGGVAATLEIDHLALTQMVAAYARRKEHEAEMQAVQIIHWLGKALDGGKGRGSSRRRARGNGRERISASQFLDMAGSEMKRS